MELELQFGDESVRSSFNKLFQILISFRLRIAAGVTFLDYLYAYYMQTYLDCLIPSISIHSSGVVCYHCTPIL